MTYVKPRPWWAVCLVYVAVGALVGASLPAAQNWAGANLGRRGIAVMVYVNVVMPTVVAAIAAAYPRLSTALIGTFLATLAFLFAAGVPPPAPAEGWLLNFVRAMPPVLFVACVVYHVIALIAVGATRMGRRVGLPPVPGVCRSCGYSLRGLVEKRCPECGAAVG